MNRNPQKRKTKAGKQSPDWQTRARPEEDLPFAPMIVKRGTGMIWLKDAWVVKFRL